MIQHHYRNIIQNNAYCSQSSAKWAFSCTESYRFGFNGMEKDDEVKGSGNSLDFGARIYDSRIARWLAIDPLQLKYPSLSPYNFVGNMPIIAIDPDGKKIKGVIYNEDTGEITYKTSATKNGTDKYIEARMRTESGEAMIKSLLLSEKKNHHLCDGRNISYS